MPDLVSRANPGYVFVRSRGPGVCHVTLTFATGFVFRSDVTFVSHVSPVTAGCGGACPTVFVPASTATIEVQNPTQTCIDLDAAGADPLDASRGDAGGH